MQNCRVRLLFRSDLHAYHLVAGRATISYLQTTQTADEPDPFRDLELLIERDSLAADLVICGGDICDKADIRGFQYAWGKLHDLRRKLGSVLLVATCGNHDLNSRHIDASEDPDPKGALQTISPQFPFDSDDLTNEFWARNFVVVSPIPSVQIVVLNTSAYHGGNEGEDQHGRVSKRTIEAIKQKLLKAEPAALNILLCHHHVRPLKGLWGSAPDHEFMKKGGELLSMLTNATASPWLVLHEHRHTPNLEHSFDPACVVVGASSFSAQVPGKLNQFHMIDIVVDDSRSQPLTGKIETWSWTVRGRWQKRPTQDDDEGFPPTCGFGAAFHPRALAGQIDTILGPASTYVTCSSLMRLTLWSAICVSTYSR